MESSMVPDVEVFKLLLNGGMFGLWAIFIVWLLWYGAPMVRDALKYVADRNDTAVDKLIQMIERHRIEDRDDSANDRAACRDSRHQQGNNAVALVGDMVKEIRQTIRDELNKK